MDNEHIIFIVITITKYLFGTIQDFIKREKRHLMKNKTSNRNRRK